MKLFSPARPHRGLSRIAALATATLALAGGAIAFAPAAQAVEYPDGHRIGKLTVVLKPGALATQNRVIQSVSTTETCPAGNRLLGTDIISFDNGADIYGDVYRAVDARSAGHGLDGNPINYMDSDSAPINGAPFSDYYDWTESGDFEYILTCSGNEDHSRPQQEGVVFFAATLHMDKATGVLSVVEPIVKVDSTTTLTGAALNTGAVTLTATVAPAAQSGTVSFRDGTGAEVGTGTVTDGVATWTSGVLTAGTEYSYTAAFAGNPALNPSTSNAVTVTTVAEPAAPQDTEIVVTIPASATGLKFTVTPGDVTLGQPTVDGTAYVATGTLGTVTVSDNRSARTAWTLNGKAGDFVNTADATKTIAASNLGWAPAAVGTTNAGTAGSAVAAGANGGLSSDKPLAQAPAGVTAAQTAVNAAVTLKAPVDSAAGTYKAKLTLTLI
ncbi:Ig-like domain repeat protein [Conyzicola sp.]|uniref:Ig-like domain repeat protein n=1 Tax=Conyzicola sp. TaxID=1969404 RepID=UPI003989D14A